MEQLQALEELAEKVEAGTDTMPDHSACYVRKNGKILADTWTDGKSTAAALGSLDAAHALHKAVLGARHKARIDIGVTARATIVLYSDGKVYDKVTVALPSNPARAWLLAIIKAKIQELEP